MFSSLEKQKKVHHLDDVIEAMVGWDDGAYKKRITDKDIHKKYDVGDAAIQKRITEIIAIDEKKILNHLLNI